MAPCPTMNRETLRLRGNAQTHSRALRAPEADASGAFLLDETRPCAPQIREHGQTICRAGRWTARRGWRVAASRSVCSVATPVGLSSSTVEQRLKTARYGFDSRLTDTFL